MIELATLRYGDKIATIGGTEVMFVAHCPEACQHQQLIVIDEEGRLEGYWADGRYHLDRVGSSLDLLIDSSLAHSVSQ